MKLQAKISVFRSRGRSLKRDGVPAEKQPDSARVSVYKARIARRVKRARRESREFTRLAVSTHDAGS